MKKRSGYIPKEDQTGRRKEYLRELEFSIQQIRKQLGMELINFEDYEVGLMVRLEKHIPMVQEQTSLTGQLFREIETFVYLLAECVSRPQLRRDYCQFLIDNYGQPDKLLLTGCSEYISNQCSEDRYRKLLECTLKLKSILTAQKPYKQHMLLHDERQRQSMHRQSRQALSRIVLEFLGNTESQLMRYMSQIINCL